MANTNDPVLRSISETKARYVRLGKSGLHVSVPILGAMSLGHKDWQPWVVEREEALRILKAAYDRGVNTWDTANVYSNGVSEEIIGEVCLEKVHVSILRKHGEYPWTESDFSSSASHKRVAGFCFFNPDLDLFCRRSRSSRSRVGNWSF